MNLFRSWILRWFVPDELQADANSQRQAVRAILFAFAMLVWWPVFTPLYVLLGSPRAGLMITAAAAAALLIMFSMRWTKSVVLTGNAIASVIYAVLVGLTCVAGGVQAAALWWLCSVPIIGLVLGGIRSGIVWAAISTITTFAFYALHIVHVAIPNDIPVEHVWLLDSLSIVGIILCAFLLTLTFKLSEDAARRELETARDASEQANRAKSMLLANMSHEIRTPMNAVIGMTDLVLATDLNRDQREYLNIVQQSGESLLVLIDDILDFSVMEARRLELNRRVFDLNEALRHLLKAQGVRAQRQGLELIYRCDVHLPRVLVGDQDRLRQVIANLIGNSIKFTPQGEIVLEVRTQSRTADKVKVQFVVSDTGIGIPHDRQRAIFHAFEQVEMSSTRRFGGAGLGLAISQYLVRLMNGEIHVESEIGKGSQFFFTAEFGLTNEDPQASLLERAAPLRGKRVLVVDDNVTSRDVLADTLESWAMTVATATHGRMGLDLLREAQTHGQPFEAVVTDAHMPAVDGFQLARQVRDDPTLDCSVIMMRAAGDLPRDEASWEETGVGAHLLKPPTPPELLEALLTLLKNAAVVAAAAEAAVADSATPQPLRILLVEDSLVNQKLAATILQNAGHQVVVAANGRAGVEAWETQSFDLVLMDVQMPEMDGIEATHVIRSQERESGQHVPIIALTAHALKGDRERCLQAGMDAYVAKPLRARSLLEIIETTRATGR